MDQKANVYAQSLYELAAEEGLQERILNDLNAVKGIFSEIPEYRKLLSSPAISKAERRSIISEAWKESVHKYTLNFIMLLCDNEMIGFFTDCFDSYHSRYNAEHNIMSVKVTVAMPVSDERISQIKEALEKKTGKELELTVAVDPSLIGGMKLESGGKIYDGSAEHHLRALRQLLQEGR